MRLFILVLSLGFGCSRSPETKDTPVAPSARASAQAKAEPLTLAGELAAVVNNCGFDLKRAVVSKCENKERTVLSQEFRNGKRSRLAALADFATALESPDEKLRVAASVILRVGFQRSLGPIEPGAVSPELARRLLATLANLPDPHAANVVPVVVHAGMNAGLMEETYLALDGLSEPKTRALGYSRVMQHGGMSAFPKIVELSAGEDEAAAAAALDALLRMPSSDLDNVEKICQLAESRLRDPRGSVAGKAALLMSDCGQGYFGKLLVELKRRREQGTLSRGLIRGTDKLCLNRGGKRPASPAQCALLKQTLKLAVEDERQKELARASALLSLGVSFPEPDVLKLAKKYQEHPMRRLRAHARQVIGRVETSRKGRETGAPKLKLTGSGKSPQRAPSKR